MSHQPRTLTHLRKSPGAWIGVVILFFIVGISIFAPWIAPFSPEDQELMRRLAAPSVEHWFGCDSNGADVLTAVLYGGRTSLFIGVVTVLISVTVGLSIGLVSGYYGGWIDQITMRVVDMLMAFPGILVALVLAATIGSSQMSIVFAIAATGWISTTRLVRGQVLSAKEEPFVQACQALGAGDFRTIVLHILPSVLSPLIVHATFSLSGVIIVESGLSFLGLGPQEGLPSWGALLTEGKNYLEEAPHLSLAPGFAIMLVVLSLNFLGDALRDALDPRS